MDISKIQSDVKRDTLTDFPERPASNLATMMLLGLAEEAGEVAGLGKRLIRGYEKDLVRATPEEFESEIGDVLWYVAGLCNCLDLDLESIWAKNREKLEERYGHA